MAPNGVLKDGITIANILTHCKGVDTQWLTRHLSNMRSRYKKGLVQTSSILVHDHTGQFCTKINMINKVWPRNVIQQVEITLSQYGIVKGGLMNDTKEVTGDIVQRHVYLYDHGHPVADHKELVALIDDAGIWRAAATLARMIPSSHTPTPVPYACSLIRYEANVIHGLAHHIDDHFNTCSRSVVCKISDEQEEPGTSLHIDGRPIPLTAGDMIEFGLAEHYVPAGLRRASRTSMNIIFKTK